MKMDDLVLVSVDDHLVEPPDMFQGHIPDKYKDDVPKLIKRADGTDAWVFEGQEATNVGLNAVAGRPPDEYGAEPTKLSEIREGCYNIHQRVADMNANGVVAAMNFPSYPQFCGQYFARAQDKSLGLAVLRAYNDWHIDEWCGTYPGRMIPLALPPIWDPNLMAEEVRRVAKKGCHAVTFSENPTKLNYPSLHDPHWDPFWQACSDVNTIVCLHIGSSSSVVITSIDAPVDTMITLQPMSIVNAAADLVWSPTLRRFPDLTFALSEGGIGWIPYFLERIDRVYKMHRAWTHQDFGDKLPSEVFSERIVTCFIDDGFGIENRHKLNLDMITWECDYPHSDSTWPVAPETLAIYLDGVPDDEINKITHENAMRIFSFDLFKHIPKEQAKVGALRAQAKDVDLGYRSSARLKKTGTDTVTVLDLAAKLPSPDLIWAAMQIEQVLTSTRSARKSLDLDAPVDVSDIRDCLRIGLQAANGSNQQSWRWLAVLDPALREKITALYRDAYLRRVGGQMLADLIPAETPEGRLMSSTEWLVDNMARVPVLVIPCYEPYLPRIEGDESFYRATLYGSVFPAVWNLQLALHTRGYGTCVTTLHLHHEEAVRELLGIPATYVQTCLLPVARLRSGHTFRPAIRRPLEEVVRVDGWDGPPI